MSRLSLLVLVIVAIALALAGCISPTATATVAPTSTPASGAPPTGYPAAAPSNTSAPYPAATLPATQAPADYPADVTATEPAPTDTPAPTATTGPVVIIYRNFEIVPESTTIQAGTEVTFQIEGDKHQPYAGSAEPWIFEAPLDLLNTTWSSTFNNAQTMNILCGYHANMSATLIVEP